MFGRKKTKLSADEKKKRQHENVRAMNRAGQLNMQTAIRDRAPPGPVNRRQADLLARSD